MCSCQDIRIKQKFFKYVSIHKTSPYFSRRPLTYIHVILWHWTLVSKIMKILHVPWILLWRNWYFNDPIIQFSLTLSYLQPVAHWYENIFQTLKHIHQLSIDKYTKLAHDMHKTNTWYMYTTQIKMHIAHIHLMTLWEKKVKENIPNFLIYHIVIEE